MQKEWPRLDAKKKKQHGIDQATMEKNELLPVQAGRVWPELAKSC